MTDPENAPGAAALPLEALHALVDSSHDLIALTDAGGRIVWCNERMRAVLGAASAVDASLLDLTLEGAAGSAGRLAMAEMMSKPEGPIKKIDLRGPAETTVNVEIRNVRAGQRLVWAMRDVGRLDRLQAEARRQGELLETAQEFGRLGVWERDIPSGEGRWDRHVFGFWGLDPEAGTPTYEQAIASIHPEDRARMNYTDSTRRAGRYTQRYRVIHPDGRTRLIQSQWEVKNGPHGVPDRALGVMMDDTPAVDAARALVNANSQLEMAVALGNIAIWRHDLQTQKIHYNGSAYTWIGRSEDTDGVPIDEVRAIIHPDDVAVVTASAMEALRTGEPNDFEARYRRTDGSWRYILTRRAVERGPGGEPVAFIGVALDVSERDAHLREAQELARRLDAASRASGIGLWTTTVDPPATDWNAQMFALFDAFEPPHAPSLGEWLRRGVHDDDRDRVARAARGFLKEGNGPFEIEFRTVTRAGGVRWIVLRSDRDPASGEQRRLLGVAMDVTEHHLALEALRTASERSALIARQAGIGLWESDVSGGMARWDEQMFLLRGMVPRDEPPGREERLAYVHPDDVPLLLDSFDTTPAALLPASYEFRVRLADGSYRWLASRSAIITDTSGRPTRRVGVNWDITESKNAQQARQQAALAEREIQAKSQFLSRMSHELRTPLNAVLGFTQLLELEARRAGRPAELEKLAHIRTAGDHLLALIDDVLELSGLEAGALRLALQPVELERVVAEAIPLVQALARERGVTIVVEAGGGTAQADPTRLRQVLINLLSNAIKYNRRGGQVVVQTRREGATAVLSVRDTGRGLAPAQIAGLFEPFKRFGREHDGIEGAGIGLAIVKAIVDGMQGRIAVSSTPGAGATFEVSLPAASGRPAELAKPAEERTPAAAAATRRGRILYIEDNHVNVLLVDELVRTVAGLSFASEPTGAAGVAHACRQPPDLVLVDLQLPDFDGYEVLRRLRAQPQTRAIPCIALSANAMPEDIERGRAAGFSDYWTKPIDFSAFIAALHRIFPAEAPGPAEGPGAAG